MQYMYENARRTAKSIRILDGIYHQARVAAVTSRKSLGLWLEEAISEKLERDSPPSQPGGIES